LKEGSLDIIYRHPQVAAKGCDIQKPRFDIIDEEQ
jgi:hypothetical protein